MDKMELKALGKINLGLDVLGRRENGYHDVRMVMQTVYLLSLIHISEPFPWTRKFRYQQVWPAEAQMRQQFFLESIRCSDWDLA